MQQVRKEIAYLSGRSRKYGEDLLTHDIELSQVLDHLGMTRYRRQSSYREQEDEHEPI